MTAQFIWWEQREIFLTICVSSGGHYQAGGREVPVWLPLPSLPSVPEARPTRHRQLHHPRQCGHTRLLSLHHHLLLQEVKLAFPFLSGFNFAVLISKLIVLSCSNRHIGSYYYQFSQYRSSRLHQLASLLCQGHLIKSCHHIMLHHVTESESHLTNMS